MTAVRGGSYRGSSDGLVVELRVVRDADEALVAIGGDVSLGDEFITSFTSTAARDEGDSVVSAEIAFRGHPSLGTGGVRVEVDERGIGAFQLGVDLDGGYRDVFAGSLERQGDFMRRLHIEIDGIDRAQPPSGYLCTGGSSVTLESAYARAGFDVTVTVDPFVGRGPEPTLVRGWTMAEVHRAMEDARGPRHPDRLSVHLFVCSYMAGKPGVLGIMYDFARDDLNRVPREGVAAFYDHPMLSDPRVPQDARDREYVYTCVHEIGHALNMLHSFDKGRPSALSWMNYPDLYPRGHEAPQGHDGSREFWQRFGETFDEQEIRHLQFATLREIRPGGLPFGVYEEGPSTIFGGPVDPHRARPGANPLRATADVSLSVGFAKPAYLLGEPVIATIGVTNVGGATAVVPRGLDPSDGHVTITVIRPRGDAVRFRPPVQLCQDAAFARLAPGEATAGFDHSPLFLSAQGPVFTEAGTYEVRAELTGVNGNRVAYARPVRVDVFCPDRFVDAVAREAFTRTDFLRALYLRHPLAAIDGWRDFEKVLEAAREQLPPEHSLAAYVDYVAAQGWMTEFASPTEPTSPADREKARERITRASRGRDGLPGAVARLERAVGTEGPPSKRTARVFVGAERGAPPLRVVVPPAGIFGTLGLGEPGEPAAQPGEPVSPFERVVKTLKGSTRFADVVSWNIEHLHSNRWKVPAVADLIRDFRCDFWGLQEVDEASLQELVATLNEGGRTKYAYVVVPERGQQSGALFRTDTTSVRVLDVPEGLFDEEIDVELAGGGSSRRAVFFRTPLLCEVRVAQRAGRVFDFRAGVVHLKSTDTKLKDKGNELRKRAAQALGKWITKDRKARGERDYVVMGDMNAETAEQGLAPFTKGNLALLSVGMKEGYGSDQALTRVASKRLLDHIVVTADSLALAPPEDIDEQIIVRADLKLDGFTGEYSDHVPVAVRFVLARDRD